MDHSTDFAAPLLSTSSSSDLSSKIQDWLRVHPRTQLKISPLKNRFRTARSVRLLRWSCATDSQSPEYPPRTHCTPAVVHPPASQPAPYAHPEDAFDSAPRAMTFVLTGLPRSAAFSARRFQVHSREEGWGVHIGRTDDAVPESSVRLRSASGHLPLSSNRHLHPIASVSIPKLASSKFPPSADPIDGDTALRCAFTVLFEQQLSIHEELRRIRQSCEFVNIVFACRPRVRTHLKSTSVARSPPFVLVRLPADFIFVPRCAQCATSALLCAPLTDFLHEGLRDAQAEAQTWACGRECAQTWARMRQSMGEEKVVSGADVGCPKETPSSQTDVEGVPARTGVLRSRGYMCFMPGIGACRDVYATHVVPGSTGAWRGSIAMPFQGRGLLAMYLILIFVFLSLHLISFAIMLTLRLQSPKGDVDDRIRLIAQQPGLKTIMWRFHTFD
ncbi:hypothetical protein B0H17DRAFT_1214925 [Mycena rosella]|uniref:Uncharacterized protein n=1 Tax=Mycena rosella TaxID=1033263 RepID=A0AAD7CLV1_MYCRO|nr:hypothetical protein B0H17DRAFT_1214925 [Mycena rosella]